MFNDLKPTSPSVNENNPQVDDIFADTDEVNSQAAGAPVAAPDNSSQQFSGYYANQAATPSQDAEAQLASLDKNLSDAEDAKGSKKVIKLVLAGIIFVLLVVLGYIIYLKLIAPKSEPVVPAPIDTSLENSEIIPVITPETGAVNGNLQDEENIPSVNSAVSDELDLVPSVPLGTTTPPVANIDSDGDGLSDQQEMILGTNLFSPDSDDDGLTDYQEVSIYLTNPLNPDSDGDGLSDYEEINIYNTDPLNSDSDNDGYSDKTEIDGGYNPNGVGKLSE
jgi:hypothetical protein